MAAVDPDKLQRVLMNLLGNAFKFVPPGGRIRCSLRPFPDELSVAVDDSGPGVKLELRQAIFERFRQGDGSIARSAGGTGLGLAIAKEFVEMHKGQVEVLDSDLGGARFQITIPRKDPAQVADGGAGSNVNAIDTINTINRDVLDGVLEELRVATPGAAVAHARSDGAQADRLTHSIVGRPRVLVVEDNADMNRFVTQCLEQHYDVTSAFDGRDGLEKALRVRPLIVVSDTHDANMSGVEMIAEMRKHPQLQATPVIVLSAKADEDLMVRLLDDGAHDFIVKPFSERELAVRVRNLVHGQQARDQLNESAHRPPRAPTAPRTSSSRCWATSCAIRSRRSSPRSS